MRISDSGRALLAAPASPTSPIAVIGDVHGHKDALERLLCDLHRQHPGVRLAFVGDIGHKGPDSVGAYRRVLDLVDAGEAALVASNHGAADARHLGRMLDRGYNVVETAVMLYRQAEPLPHHATLWHVARLAGSLAGTADGEELAERIVASQRSAPLQLSLDGGEAMVVHGGITVETFGAAGRRAQQVCLYGTPTGRDGEGLPVDRDSWVADWCAARDQDRRLPFVFYGHITYPEPRLTDHTCGVDTGCGSRAEATLSAAVWSGSSEPLQLLQVDAALT
jgi:hypothetical protein